MNSLNHFVLRFSYLFLISFVLLVFNSCSRRCGMFEGMTNIGSKKVKGSVEYDGTNGTYTISGAGTNMWDTSDEFFMAWKEVTGDFTISGRPAFEGEGVDPHRKIGLIVRSSLDKDAVYADVAVHGDGLTSLQYRSVKGGITEEIVSENKAPHFISLERRGNMVSMKTIQSTFPNSIDSEIEIELPETCYVGIFICSHNPDVIETGYFTSVRLR